MGKVLGQNGNYEIPAMKKNIGSLESQAQECVNKTQDSKAAIRNADQEFKAQCVKLGITGEDAANEILGTLSKIPNIFKGVVENIKNPLFREALDYYYDFSVYVNPNIKKEDVQLKLAEYINKEDDDLVDLYNLKSGKKSVPGNLENSNKHRYNKYFQHGKKATGSSSSAPKIIDIDITIEDSGNANAAAIDWSGFEILEQSANPPANQSSPQKAPEFADFEIIESKDDEEECPEEDTLLAKVDTRNQLLIDLNELLFFVKQRILENQGISGNVVLQAYEQSETHLEKTNEKLKDMQKVIAKAIELLIDHQANQLFILKEQPKARERLVNHLNNFRVTQQRHREVMISTEKKGYEIEKLLTDSKKTLQTISKETVELKKQLEAAMKALIGREIHVIGDVNKIRA